MTVKFFVSAKRERAAEWRSVFGISTLPVLSPYPQLVQLPGKGRVHAYMLDVQAINNDSWNRLINHISEKFGVSAADAGNDLVRNGMPIPVDDELIVPTIDLRFFL